MSDLEESSVRPLGRVCGSRPSLSQVKAVIYYMEKHPDLCHLSSKKNRLGNRASGNAKFKRHWLDLSNILNSIEGTVKSTKGWIKFWSDKKRSIQTKQRDISEGRLKCALTLIEQKILDLCDKPYIPKKKKAVKQEPCNGDDDDSFIMPNGKSSSPAPTEADLKQLTMIENMVGVMDQQASAMSQIAQASLTNSKALETIAEASHIQALAVDRLVGTFATISGSAHDIRNAILGIDYTLKSCYPTPQRSNSTLFS